MNNLRRFSTLLLVLLTGGAMFGVSYWAASRTRIALVGRQTDDLAWMCREFRLTDADIARIRPLHEGYQPKCETMCARIAAKNGELSEILLVATNVGPEVERKLGEVAALRAECQAEMLRHFQQVARTMPREQGARYLAEMQRFTLDLRLSVEDMAAHP